MTPEQLAEIEQRWEANKNRQDNFLLQMFSIAYGSDVTALLQEVRRLNRMVDKAVEMLHAEIDCPLDEKGIRIYLESESEK